MRHDKPTRQQLPKSISHSLITNSDLVDQLIISTAGVVSNESKHYASIISNLIIV